MKIKTKLRITIDLDLTPVGGAKVESDRGQFQKFADDMAKHFKKDTENIRGVRANIELR